MKAIITSIGEPTLELCQWSLERNGFDVTVIYDPKTSLWDKLKQIYTTINEDFVRIDADVVPNKYLNTEYLDNLGCGCDSNSPWWYQFMTYDWYKQDVTHGGIQFIRKEALSSIRKHINECERMSRPESYLYRIEEFHKPVRRCISVDSIVGLHGYAQRDVDRVKSVKTERGQIENYDFDLSDRLNQL